ncbi:MAG: hypothetical protein EBZ77_13740, partial [Chitinophagia bacterium]|nr:hypothetical protein [Chitinophagia bacterium]
VAEKLAHFSADGKIDYYDNVGRPMTPKETHTAPAGLTADQVFANYINSIGGEKAIKSIKSIKTVSTGEVQGIPITITEIKKAPASYKSVITGTVQGNTMTFQKQVFNGTKGYMEAQGGKKDLSADEITVLKEEADLYADLNPAKYGIKRTLKGVESVDGNDAYVVTAVNARNKTVTEYYDVKSGLLVRKVETEESDNGAVSQTVDYKNYKEVAGGNGYKVAYSITQSGAGPGITATVQSVDINTEIPASEFE